MTLRVGENAFIFDDTYTPPRMVGFKQPDGTETFFNFAAGPSVGGTAAAPAVPNAGLLYGLTTANNGTDAVNDIDIAAGQALDSTNTLTMVLAAGVTRQLDALYGTGSGGRFDTSISDGTWFVFLVSNGVTVNVGFSKLLDPRTAPSYPAGFTYFRRIGAILRESSAIVLYEQVGDRFRRVPVSNYTGTGGANGTGDTNPGDAAVTKALSVPLLIRVQAVFAARLIDTTPAAGSDILFSELSMADTAPSVTVSNLAVRAQGAVIPANDSAELQLMTNTSGQIRYRMEGSTADANVFITTLAWFDTRGRNA